ncbi:MAG: hypothetical protein M3495_03215 [Pseudomonadota bacterium]|nr:hypothetical protein [Gammaproteobacteria bacterium]MDQ3580677.1 hypothetical protein [Pseudomonadota bacterium]
MYDSGLLYEQGLERLQLATEPSLLEGLQALTCLGRALALGTQVGTRALVTFLP